MTGDLQKAAMAIDAREPAKSALLSSRTQVDEAERWARSNGLGPPFPREKNWDNAVAVQAIQADGIERSEPIADLGCCSSIILAWLRQLGFEQLYGCDLRSPFLSPLAALARRQFKTAWQYLGTDIANWRRLKIAKLEESGFPEGHFAAVTSMSVIEHGVNVPQFFREAHRLLRPGGLLLVSTDYWPEPIDLQGLKRYSKAEGQDTIFDRAGALELCEVGEAAGLELLGRPELEVDEPIVHWHGRSYTFLFLAFRKPG